MQDQDNQVEFIKTIHRVWNGDASKLFIADVMFNLGYINIQTYVSQMILLLTQNPHVWDMFKVFL